MALHSRPFVCHNGKHHVYRLFAGDVCLYVGMTKDLPNRLAQHHSKPWWDQVDRIEEHWVWGREIAMLTEEHYIRKLNPLHNKVGWGGVRRG